LAFDPNGMEQTMKSLVGCVALRKTHADSHEALSPLKDEDRSGRNRRSPDNARRGSLAFTTPPMTLLVTERAFEVFRALSADSIDPTFITLHRFYSLLRNHLPSTARSAPHTLSLHHDHPSSDITPCVHSGARSKPEGSARRTGKSQPSDLSCSALVVSLDFDGLLHTMLAGLLHPATGHEVDDVSGSLLADDQHTEARLSTGQMGLPHRHTPSEEFHSLRAAPRLRGQFPLAVTSTPPLHRSATPKPLVPPSGRLTEPPKRLTRPNSSVAFATKLHLPHRPSTVASVQVNSKSDDSPVGTHTFRCRKTVSSSSQIRGSTSGLFSPSESVTPCLLAKTSTPYPSMGLSPLQDPFLPLDARWPEPALHRRGGVIINAASDAEHTTKMAVQIGV